MLPWIRGFHHHVPVHSPGSAIAGGCWRAPSPSGNQQRALLRNSWGSESFPPAPQLQHSNTWRFTSPLCPRCWVFLEMLSETMSGNSSSQTPPPPHCHQPAAQNPLLKIYPLIPPSLRTHPNLGRQQLSSLPKSCKMTASTKPWPALGRPLPTRVSTGTTPGLQQPTQQQEVSGGQTTHRCVTNHTGISSEQRSSTNTTHHYQHSCTHSNHSTTAFPACSLQLRELSTAEPNPLWIWHRMAAGMGTTPTPGNLGLIQPQPLANGRHSQAAVLGGSQGAGS